MKILVIEDDKQLNKSICELLTKSGYTVNQSHDGEEGLFLATEGIYDLIILDIMLPKLDGYAVLKKMHEADVRVPVIYISAKDTVEDRIKGLRLKADDYLIKPFNEMELLLRVQAILRRNEKDDTLSFGEIQLIAEGRYLLINEEKCFLKGKQFELVEYLMQNPGRILTKEHIFDKVWGIYSDTTITVVEVYIHAIRKILKKYQIEGYLKTIRGVGYMLSTEAIDEKK